MASKIAGVTVLEDGNIKWGVIAGLILGVPTYAYSYGVGRAVSMMFAGLEWMTLGPLSFVTQLIDIAFLEAQFGIWRSNYSFIQALEGAGVFAPVFAAVGTFLIAGAMYLGVTAVYG